MEVGVILTVTRSSTTQGTRIVPQSSVPRTLVMDTDPDGITYQTRDVFLETYSCLIFGFTSDTW